MRPPSSQEQEINLLELVKKVWDSRKLILRMCGIGAIVSINGIKTHQTVSDALSIVENL